MYEPVAEDLADDDEIGAGLGDRRNALPGHPTPVRVLLRGLELMQALSRHGPLTTASLSQKLRLARTTVNRCLATLEGCGFVERLPNRRYALTAKAVTLSHGYDAAIERIEPVRMAMHASSARVQWPMSLMRLQFPELFIEDSTDRESGFAVEYFELACWYRCLRPPPVAPSWHSPVRAFVKPYSNIFGRIARPIPPCPGRIARPSIAKWLRPANAGMHAAFVRSG